MLFDIQKEPSSTFFNFCRMTSRDFEYLLNKIGPIISRNDTNMRKCIPVQERFAIALRFFASGDSYTSICYISSKFLYKQFQDVSMTFAKP